MPNTNVLAFPAWLLANARPGSADPLSALTADICKRAGRRLPATPADLAVLLQAKGAPASIHAAAVAAQRFAAARLAETTEAAR
jgi:hypothetical protein